MTMSITETIAAVKAKAAEMGATFIETHPSMQTLDTDLRGSVHCVSYNGMQSLPYLAVHFVLLVGKIKIQFLFRDDAAGQKLCNEAINLWPRKR